MAMFHSIWTAILVVIFLGIVAWAWSGHRKEAFNEASLLPLENDELIPSSGEKHDG